MPASVLDGERGAHDLFYRHLALGDAVADVWDRTETLQFVEDYVTRRFGWNVHRRMMFEYGNELAPLRDLLLGAGYTEWEALPVLYSRCAGADLGWLWDLAALGVDPARVTSGLALVGGFDPVGVPPAARFASPRWRRHGPISAAITWSRASASAA